MMYFLFLKIISVTFFILFPAISHKWFFILSLLELSSFSKDTPIMFS